MRLFRFILLFFMVTAGTALFGQPLPPPPPNPVPLSGVEWLLIAGGALGVGRLWFVKKRKVETSAGN